MPKEEKIKKEDKKILKKKINKFFNDNFKWLVVIVVIIILLFGFFKLIIPQYKETVRIAEIITQQETVDVKSKEQELEMIKKLLLSFEKIDSRYVDKIDAIVPFKYNKEELFTEFKYIVRNSGLKLQSINISDGGASPIGTSKISKRLRKIIINISVKGTDYKAFKNFLSILENNLKLMDIENVSFNPDGKSTQLIINTYYIK